MLDAKELERKMALAKKKIREQKEGATANLQLDASADKAARKAASAKRGKKDTLKKSNSMTDTKSVTNGVESTKSIQQSKVTKVENAKPSSNKPTKAPFKSKDKSTNKPFSNNSNNNNSNSKAKSNSQQSMNGKLVNNKQGKTVDAKSNPLLSEIIALGGDEDDFSLLDDGAISADEGFVPDAQEDKKLSGEIGNMLKELGLNNSKKVAQWSTVTDNASEDEEEEEEDNVEEEEEEEELVKVMKETSIKDSGKSKLLIEANSFWHQITLPSLESTAKPLSKPSESQVASLLEKAQKLVEDDAELYEARSSLGGKDRTFLRTLLKSGTLTDKVSALTLLIQESPVHAVKTFASLLTMCRKKSRKEAVMTIASMKDFFTNSGLPDRKLVYFCDQPINHPKVTSKHLALWWFEDYLKKYYYEFLQVIEELSHDTLMHIKLNMIGYMLDLLSAKPEQEQNLLRLLVNKLGDREKKVASKASHMLLQLFIQHPNMKLVVIRAIEEFLVHSPDPMAQYYAIVTLNQVILTRSDTEAANRLVDLYFVYFRKLLKQQQDGQLRGGSATANNDGKSQGNKKGAAKKNRKQLERERKAEESAQSRIAIETKMVAQVLTGVNRAFPFAKVADDVYENHLDTLFRVAHTGTFNVVVQALKLIYQTSVAKQAVSDRFYRVLYESLLDSRLAGSSKQAMYLNLLYRALKEDQVSTRVKSFIKRLGQTTAYQQAPFGCGALFLISELMTEAPGLKMMITQPEDDDQDEHFTDVDDGEEDKQQQQQQEMSTDQVINNENEDTPRNTNASSTSNKTTCKYDGRKRDPRYSGADYSCLWELALLSKHYHPSLSHHVQCLLEGERITEMPQLHLHTLSHFLDRFVYRNPKKATSNNSGIVSRGASIMQPAERDHLSSGVFVWQRQSGMMSDELAVNSEQFLKQTDIKADELFFHKFFKARQEESNRRQTNKDKKRKRTGDDDDEFSDADIEAAILGHRPVDSDDEDNGSDDNDDDDIDVDDVSLGEDDEELDEDDVWSAMQRDMPSELRRGLPNGGGDLDGDDDDDLDDDEEAAFAKLMEDDDSDQVEQEVEEDEDEDEDVSINGSDAELATLWSDEDDSEDAMSQGEEEEEDDDDTEGGETIDDENQQQSRKKRRKTELPTFASFDDYAHLIEQNATDDMDE
ncbi:CBF/Mak21 family-domain-containing protein [Syncephalis plumigaleata]|nr:CBF/Mak21 family-domain-containing protein [Syncephalis plumigaleata]